MKRCPRCSNLLTETQVGNVRVDGCNGCGGVWFDNKELSTITQTQAAQLTALEDQFLPNVPEHLFQSEMKCPVCVVPLYEFEFPHSPGIKLDACPLCKGIWADDGELQMIHNRLRRVQENGTAPPTETRQKARQVAGFLASVACPKCLRPNPAVSFACWACGARLADEDRKRICPNCHLPLSTKNYFGKNLDYCSTCTGVWMDNGELATLARRGPEELQALEAKMDENDAAISAAWDEEEHARLCPACCVPMEEQQYAYSSGVRIDVCRQCSGVWVGGGKLPQISLYYNRTLGRSTIPAPPSATA